MTPMLIWAAALGLELLALYVKFRLVDRTINALAGELVRMSKFELDAAKQARQLRLQFWNDVASWTLLVVIVVTIALLPPLPSERLYTTVRSATAGWLMLALMIFLLQLELSPFFYRSVARLRVRGMLVETLKLAIAAGALLAIVTLPESEQTLFTHPIYLYRVRQFLLGNMAFCGGLTLYREYRRRVRTGDLFEYGTFDSLSVSLQVLILFNVVGVVLTAPVIMGLQITELLDPRQTIAAGLNFLAFIWTCVSIAYFVLFLLRRVSRARGFSWIDPPNWRVAIPHLRYHFRANGFFQLLALLAAPMIALAWLTASPKPLSWIGAPIKLGIFLLELAVAAMALLYRFAPADARGLGRLLPRHWPSALTQAWRHGFSAPLADIERVTYLRALFGPAASDAALIERVTRGAAIAPLGAQQHARVVRFDIIGDPGEGDDSQLYPANRRHGDAKQAISATKERKTPAEGAAPDSPATLLSALLEQPDGALDDLASIDFTIISSDVIYPGGEMFDYERAFYRPNAPRDRSERMFAYGRPGASAIGELVDRSPPYYAIPGNHDWYDSLHGFLNNFTYNAAIGRPDQRVARIKRRPWDWRPWRKAALRRVSELRRRYRLRGAGGLPAQRSTHQHLSFFEMNFGAAPLAVFGLDNGVTGSIDYVQFHWLARRLEALRADPRSANSYVLVLVGNPLYVDGAFAGDTEAGAPSPQPQESFSPREIYELLRRHHVDVVMGGDTHAYQRYQVHYVDEDGQQHVMHQIVNGGGGAYLSPPMDAGWLDFEPQRGRALQLSRRGVYHPGVWGRDDALDARADRVTLHDLFPTFNQMMDKFVWHPAEQKAAARAHSWVGEFLSGKVSFGVLLRAVRAYGRATDWFRRKYNAAALRSGFTNALNHDETPLLQSYVQVELAQRSGAWRLRLIPYIEQAEPAAAETAHLLPEQQRTLKPQFDRQLELPERRIVSTEQERSSQEAAIV